jgi:hypothetical protein
MNNDLLQETTNSDTGTFDVFVSYAHADDETPAGAERGWVTTLVGELQKVLRRKLGGTGARVWMDHMLAANQAVTGELLERVALSRTLLLVMSPGYRRSDWCQRELGNFVARASARGQSQNVFPIEIEPIPREEWPAALQCLTPIPFWERQTDRLAPKLAGFPRPKPDEDSLYWTNVNELAHLIAEHLRAHGDARPATPKTAVVLAETTDESLEIPHRELAAALRQRNQLAWISTDHR